MTNTLITIALAAWVCITGVVAWLSRKVVNMCDRVTRIEARDDAAARQCQECRKRISDVIRTSEQMKVVIGSHREQAENVSSALTLLGQQAEQLTTVESKVSRLDSKVDTLVDLVRNGHR